MPKRKTLQEFIKQAINVHGNRYDYSLVNYVNIYTKIKIICKIHGVFVQDPHEHLKGCGCRICGFYSKKHILPKITIEEFIKRCNEIHYNKYDYSKVILTIPSSKVIIMCPKHGEFKQTIHCHLDGRGCPKCSSSTGEINIRKFLDANKIEYISQKIFKDKKPYNKLRFDFFLPFLNTIIEYNGAQHYKPVKLWGGDKSFIRQQDVDKRKLEFCGIYNINLITIPYTQFDNINKILIDNLFLPTAR